ncbi:MAG: Tetratricopeptide 2 repeat protein [Bryobacterales bacterium]|nr:Tetratricopeptide 2 repeat protein [Bryobacterales bacterium]
MFADMRDPIYLIAVVCITVVGLAGASPDTDAQIAAYQRLARTNPDNLHAQNTLAGAYIQKMRETTDFAYIDRASRIIDRVLSIEPRDYEALRLRSEIALERHQFAEVAEFSRQMITTTPDDAWNWGTFGDALMELGQYDGAAEAYQKMVALRPNQSSYNRASYYRWVMGDAEGAIAIMQQAIAAGSGSPENTAWCLVDLGNMFFKTGPLGQATDAYKAALRTFSGYYPAYAGLGRVQAAQGSVEDAIDSFKHAQAAVPMPEYAAALAELYDRKGKKAEARRQIELIDVVDKMARANNEKTNRNLALVFADEGRNLDRALELAEAELKVRSDVYTFDALAWTLFKKGKLAEAAEAARKALQFATPEPGFYYHAGMIAHALGNKPEARKHLERALALNPRFDPRQSEIAEAALRTIHN